MSDHEVNFSAFLEPCIHMYHKKLTVALKEFLFRHSIQNHRLLHSHLYQVAGFLAK